MLSAVCNDLVMLSEAKHLRCGLMIMEQSSEQETYG